LSKQVHFLLKLSLKWKIGLYVLVITGKGHPPPVRDVAGSNPRRCM